MGIGSWWHWLIVLLVALLLFGGGGKIPKLMRDMGQGINAFKRGLKEEDKDKTGDGDDDDKKALEDDSKGTARVESASEEQQKAAKG